MEIAKIMFLEDKLEKLEKELYKTKRDLNETRIVHWQNEQTEKMDDEASPEEMHIIYQLLEAHILFNSYDMGATVPKNYFIEKVAGMLGQDEEDILETYNGLLSLYMNKDDFLEEEEIAEKLNFFRDNLEQIEQDDFTNFHV